MLVLALADAHIPDRAIDIPEKFKKLLNVPDKISQVLLLGNCTKSYSFNEFIRSISSNVAAVRGEFDNSTYSITKSNGSEDIDIPMSVVIEVGDFKIGCCSGYTVVPKNDPLSMLNIARQLDVDILLWGGTHNVEAYTLENKFFVNPGSCTGAFNTDWPVLQKDEEFVKEDDIKVSESTQTQDGDVKNDINETKTNTANGGDKEKPDADKSKNGVEEKSDKNNVDEETKLDDKNEIKEGKEDEGEISDASLDIDITEFDINGSNVPSFCLLDIQGSVCTLYIYLHLDDEVKVDKVVYEKNQ